MRYESTLAEVIEVLGIETGKEVLHTSRFRELGDSLELFECVMALEERFGIDIDDEVAGAWSTVADAAKMVHEAVGS